MFHSYVRSAKLFNLHPPAVKSRRKPSGFTLIELLVVIAIIAILAAILFPVFAQAREKARQASCLSNEKQIGLAILQYNQDYDEMMPVNLLIPPPTPPATGSQRTTWIAACYPYMKTMQIWRCPNMVDATSGGNSIWNTTGSTIGSIPWRNTSIWEAYGYNVDFMNQAQGDCSDYSTTTSSGPPTPLAKISKPASTVMVVGMAIQAGSILNKANPGLYPPNGGYFDIEAPDTYTAPDDCGPSGWGLNSWGGAYGGFEVIRHSMQGGNVCFCDGHVKFMTPGALAAGTNWTATTDVSAVVRTDASKYLWGLN